jgi:hypothetical protein
MLYPKNLVPLDSAEAGWCLPTESAEENDILVKLLAEQLVAHLMASTVRHHYWRAWAYLVHRESQFRCDVLLTFRVTFLLVLKPLLLP